MDWGIVWGIIGGATGLVSLGIVLFTIGRFTGKLETRLASMEVRLKSGDDKFDRVLHKLEQQSKYQADIDKEIAVLSAKMGIFWKTVEETVPKDLIAPHSPRRDELLLKMSYHNLKIEESEELLADLEQNIGEFNGKKLSVVLLIARLRQVVHENAVNAVLSEQRIA